VDIGCGPFCSSGCLQWPMTSIWWLFLLISLFLDPGLLPRSFFPYRDCLSLNLSSPKHWAQCLSFVPTPEEQIALLSFLLSFLVSGHSALSGFDCCELVFLCIGFTWFLFPLDQLFGGCALTSCTLRRFLITPNFHQASSPPLLLPLPASRS